MGQLKWEKNIISLWFNSLNGQECVLHHTVVFLFCFFNATRKVLIFCSEIFFHRSCLLCNDGYTLYFWQSKAKKNIIWTPSLSYSSPNLECKPSPIPDISTHFCQLPHWTGALRSDSLVTGPAGDARVSSASTFLYPCTCVTGLPSAAQVPRGAPQSRSVVVNLERGGIEPQTSYSREYLTFI